MKPGANIVLIGMPGAGKSTIGVLVAKRLSRDFLDTDVAIQRAAGRTLQDIINRDGLGSFRALEERYVCGLQCRATVIATGGSVVYSEPAMRHLAGAGVVVFLDVPLDELTTRLIDFDERGLVRRPGQSLAELYAERLPLYRRWADITVQCRGLGQGEIAGRVASMLAAEEVH